jgi:hypothetical protein
MKTEEQELLELSAKQAADILALKAKHAVLGLLGDLITGYQPPFVHYSKLYGTKGSLNFGHCQYDSIREGKNPNRALLAALLAKFPPLPKVLYKDGCTSFRWEGGITEKDKQAEAEGRTNITEVYPVIIKIETAQSQTAKFCWCADLGGLGVWSIVVEIPLHATTLGLLYLDAKRWPDGKIIRYTQCEFRPSNPAVQVITWASGGQEYPKTFTLYTDPDSGKEIDWPGFIKA